MSEPSQPPPRKPLGIKSYGSIGHLPGSRVGPGDHTCPDGQKIIATAKARDKHDHIIVQEKLDGSNVGVVQIDGQILALNRAGYPASSSPYEHHRHFAEWVARQEDRFRAVLQDGERLCGEWLMLAHGTRYDLKHEPFVAFDLMVGADRMIYDEFSDRVRAGDIVMPHLIHRGKPLSIEDAMSLLNIYGFHGALDPVEGAVWRVERDELIRPGRGSERRRVFDFLAKYVRPDKVDGCYLTEISGQPPVYNWKPNAS